MLIDRIARLERQLETAEGRVRNAEQSAKSAKSALTDTLLAKARHQKSGHAPAESRPPRSTRGHPPEVPDAEEDTERALRAEYEQKFHAARDRLAREFQERLNEAQASWKAEAARRISEERSRAIHRLPARNLPKVEVLSGSRGDAHHRTSRTASIVRSRSPLRGPHVAIFLALALTAGAGILMARGTFRAAKTPPPALAVTSAPLPAVTAATTTPDTAPKAHAPTASAEPAPVPAADTRVTEPRTDHARGAASEGGPTSSGSGPATVRTDNATTADVPAAAPQPAEADRATASDTAAGAAKAGEAVTVLPAAAIEAQRKILERDAALAAKLDTLRERVDSATRRAQIAEAALRAERRKAAEEAAKRQQLAPKAASPKESNAAPGASFPSSSFYTVE